MITFHGEQHCVDVSFEGAATIPTSGAQFYATDCQFDLLELDTGNFQSVYLTNTLHIDNLTLNGGGNFQAVIISGSNFNNGNLNVNGSFPYGCKIDANMRQGSATLTDLDNATLNLNMVNPISLTLDTCNRNKLDVNISEASQHGIHLTDSSSNRITGLVTDAGRQTTNTYDGVLLDGNSDRNHLALTVSYSGAGNQMRYGANISAATCDVNVESSILSGAGATGAFNDAGTGTVLTDEHIV